MILKRMAMFGIAGLATACVDTTPKNSPAAIAALPPGVNESFLIKDGNDCYFLGIEAGDPQTGVPLLDASGTQVCDA